MHSRRRSALAIRTCIPGLLGRMGKGTCHVALLPCSVVLCLSIASELIIIKSPVLKLKHNHQYLTLTLVMPRIRAFQIWGSRTVSRGR